MKLKILRNIGGHPELKEGTVCDVDSELANTLLNGKRPAVLELTPPPAPKAVEPKPARAEKQPDQKPAPKAVEPPAETSSK